MKTLKAIVSWISRHRRGLGLGLLRLMLLAVVIFGIIWWVRAHRPNILPKSLRSQVNFTVLYPKGYPIDQNSWKVVDNDGVPTLSFSVTSDNNTMVFTEQKVPLIYRDDEAAYNRFIGSLKPGVNFNTPLGNVSLVGFVTAGDYKPEGRSAVMKAKGTLLIAHPSEMINDQSWSDMFNSVVAN